jgi:hypothetical protein
VFRRTPRRILTVALVALCGLAAPAAANASSAVVSNSATVVPGGKTCAAPAFSSVQTAITSGATKVSICPGTYTEQIEIVSAVKLVDASGAGTATLALPADAGNSQTVCDTMDGLEQIDEVSICTGGTVSITGVNVEAVIPLETCGKGLNGIFVGDQGLLKAVNVVINGASTSLDGFKGCQHGVAVEVGSKTPLEVGHASLKKVTVHGYEKNGPTVKGANSTLEVTNSTITGEGPTPFTAQNGIEVAFGASGKVKSTSVVGNECNVGSCGATGEQASGVLFFGAAAGSTVSSSTIKENDLGVYYASDSVAVPSSADVTMTGDVLTSNRYEGVVLEEGKAGLKSDTINGSGRVGIELFQVEGQHSASESSATATNISGQSEAAIKVTSDKQPGDIAGTFSFSGTATAPVLINESNNFTVLF